MVQVHVLARAWGFKSLLRHHFYYSPPFESAVCRIYFLRIAKIEYRGIGRAEWRYTMRMREYSGKITLLLFAINAVCFPTLTADQAGALPDTAQAKPGLEWIRVEKDHFICEGSHTPFSPWGFNYDHDASGRLIEDYWNEEWPKVVEDFGEMKALGANVIRIHLQVGKFLKTPEQADESSLKQLARLVKLAEDTGLYLDLTGLACYHKKDVPEWYDGLSEAQRWDVQARFWEAIAKTCAGSPAIFCYDLMNEPILPGAGKPETEWLTGELGGKFFVQRITLDLAGRTPVQVAKAWVEKLAMAIRKHDTRHMITVGVIPWEYTFPGAKPLFYAKEASAPLDFVSVHFYPEKGKVDKAITALAAYEIDKPIVEEEMFPLKCSLEELDAFIQASKNKVDGYIGFYWGKTIEEYAQDANNIGSAITKGWLEYFKENAAEMKKR